jgi:co-chaperonin GroES (HSP10)
VVKRLEGEEKTKGGIIIPDTVKEKPKEGKVIAVALGGRDENGKLTPSTSRPANRILFGKWPGTACVRSHLGRVCSHGDDGVNGYISIRHEQSPLAVSVSEVRA